MLFLSVRTTTAEQFGRELVNYNKKSVSWVIKIHFWNFDLIFFQVIYKSIYYSFLKNGLYTFISKDYLGIILLPQAYPKNKYLQPQNYVLGHQDSRLSLGKRLWTINVY